MDPHSPNEQRCRDLIAAYRGERMPPARRAAAWERLQAEIGGADGSPARAHARDRRRDLAWAAVLAVAAVLVLVFGARGRMSRVAGPDEGSQALHEAGASTDSPAPVMNAPGETAEARTAAESQQSAAPSEPTPPVQRASQARAQDVSKDMPALDAELALLRAVREALARSTPAAALAPLDRHAREFPAGHLREERMLLRAQAQCELGQREAAWASAAELMREFPESPHARTVAGLCAD